ncbi:MAG: IscA/HesB family protein [Desulfobulbaceae bacterium]|nr:IscA/HesB family protein [Desulfobulbaceae bacterium]
MFEVTPAALSNIKDYLRQQKIDSPIRITLISGGCSGPSLGLAIDDAKDQDDEFDHDGVIFVVERTLFASCGRITVDFIEKSTGGCGDSGGFRVSSEKSLSAGGCSCSCSSGSCG